VASAVPAAMVDGTQQHTVLVDGQRSAHNGGRDLTTDACAQVTLTPQRDGWLAASTVAGHTEGGNAAAVAPGGVPPAPAPTTRGNGTSSGDSATESGPGRQATAAGGGPVQPPPFSASQPAPLIEPYSSVDGGAYTTVRPDSPSWGGMVTAFLGNGGGSDGPFLTVPAGDGLASFDAAAVSHQLPLSSMHGLAPLGWCDTHNDTTVWPASALHDSSHFAMPHADTEFLMNGHGDVMLEQLAKSQPQWRSTSGDSSSADLLGGSDSLFPPPPQPPFGVHPHHKGNNMAPPTQTGTAPPEAAPQTTGRRVSTRAAAAAAAERAGDDHMHDGGAPAPGDASKRMTVSMDVLRQYFGLNLVEAAKRLGMCRTTLKRICRQHGIKRWPKRELNAIQSSGRRSRPVSREGSFRAGVAAQTALAQQHGGSLMATTLSEGVAAALGNIPHDLVVADLTARWPPLTGGRGDMSDDDGEDASTFSSFCDDLTHTTASASMPNSPGGSLRAGVTSGATALPSSRGGSLRGRSGRGGSLHGASGLGATPGGGSGSVHGSNGGSVKRAADALSLLNMDLVSPNVSQHGRAAGVDDMADHQLHHMMMTQQQQAGVPHVGLMAAPPAIGALAGGVNGAAAPWPPVPPPHMVLPAQATQQQQQQQPRWAAPPPIFVPTSQASPLLSSPGALLAAGDSTATQSPTMALRRTTSLGGRGSTVHPLGSVPEGQPMQPPVHGHVQAAQQFFAAHASQLPQQGLLRTGSVPHGGYMTAMMAQQQQQQGLMGPPTGGATAPGGGYHRMHGGQDAMARSYSANDLLIGSVPSAGIRGGAPRGLSLEAMERRISGGSAALAALRMQHGQPGSAPGGQFSRGTAQQIAMAQLGVAAAGADRSLLGQQQQAPSGVGGVPVEPGRRVRRRSSANDTTGLDEVTLQMASAAAAAAAGGVTAMDFGGMAPPVEGGLQHQPFQPLAVPTVATFDDLFPPMPHTHGIAAEVANALHSAVAAGVPAPRGGGPGGLSMLLSSSTNSGSGGTAGGGGGGTASVAPNTAIVDAGASPHHSGGSGGTPGDSGGTITTAGGGQAKYCHQCGTRLTYVNSQFCQSCGVKQ